MIICAVFGNRAGVHMSRTIMISGASSGFGRACAKRFAQAGDRLVLLARRKERLQALAAELGRADDVQLLVCDVTDAAQLEQAVSSLQTPFDAPDILINHAGLGNHDQHQRPGLGAYDASDFAWHGGQRSWAYH
jgi:NADP-dependent 3-hydroxy acid dehydrogenase YdfG